MTGRRMKAKEGPLIWAMRILAPGIKHATLMPAFDHEGTSGDLRHTLVDQGASGRVSPRPDSPTMRHDTHRHQGSFAFPLSNFVAAYAEHLGRLTDADKLLIHHTITRDYHRY